MTTRKDTWKKQGSYKSFETGESMLLAMDKETGATVLEPVTKRVTPNVKRQEDTNALMDELQVFWAFGNKQFEEGFKKLNLSEGEKVVDIGAGGFMPKKNIDLYIAGMKKIDLEFKKAMKDEKARKAHILWELSNHEAYYTRSIESTMDALGEDFTEEEVMKLFKHKNT